MNRFSAPHTQFNRSSPSPSLGGRFGRSPNGGGRRSTSGASTTHPTRDFSTSRGRGGFARHPDIPSDTYSVQVAIKDIKANLESKPIIAQETVPKGILKSQKVDAMTMTNGGGNHSVDMNNGWDAKNGVKSTQPVQMNNGGWAVNGSNGGTHPAANGNNGNGQAKTVTFDTRPMELNGGLTNGHGHGESNGNGAISVMDSAIVNGGHGQNGIGSGLQMAKAFAELNNHAHNADHCPAYKQFVVAMMRTMAKFFGDYAGTLDELHSAHDSW